MFNLDNYMLEQLYNIFGGIAILYGSIDNWWISNLSI